MQQYDLVLAGGGHTHVLAIKQLAMQPIAGVRVTLVSEQPQTPYSGMLPGFVAGHYQHEDILIDLPALCTAAGVRWIEATVSGIDAATQRVQLQGQAELAYDVLSLDTGSQPGFDIPGAREFATGVKPISRFHRQWQQVLAALQHAPAASRQRIAIIGAGVGGTELCLALAHRLSAEQGCELHLVYPHVRLMPGLPEKAAAIAQQALLAAQVHLHPNFRVSRIDADKLIANDGAELAVDQTFFCTGAAAPTWLANSGLSLSETGFVLVERSLQSVSHPHVFGAGDVAEIGIDPRPKAGVYAVRQAPVLVTNLRRYFAGKPLRQPVLQRDYLRLVSLGEQRAIACRNGLTLAGLWAWRWKHRIDKRFMQQFAEFEGGQSMPAVAADNGIEQPMHCAGCGSKLGPAMLQQSLDSLAPPPASLASSTVLHNGTQQAEDAVLWQAGDGQLMVQSIDGFRSFSDDLYRVGAIAVNHALNDVYAMGATPEFALAWTNTAYNAAALQARDHQRLLAGINSALQAQGATLAGGHSTEGPEHHVAIVANGRVAAGKVWRKHGMEPGQQLVLTRALGSGVILAAAQQAKAPPRALQAAMAAMLESNQAAASALQPLQPSAVTDVSGFGLLGHLLEMLVDDRCTVQLQLSQIPALPGALELLAGGFHSSLRPALAHYLQHCQYEPETDTAALELLLDPQTSGGLLVALAPAAAEQLVANIAGSAIIGQADVFANVKVKIKR